MARNNNSHFLLQALLLINHGGIRAVLISRIEQTTIQDNVMDFTSHPHVCADKITLSLLSKKKKCRGNADVFSWKHCELSAIILKNIKINVLVCEQDTKRQTNPALYNVNGNMSVLCI